MFKTKFIAAAFGALALAGVMTASAGPAEAHGWGWRHGWGWHGGWGFGGGCTYVGNGWNGVRICRW
jgi:Spy/CpxP family protein refolding chaperone